MISDKLVLTLGKSPLPFYNGLCLLREKHGFSQHWIGEGFDPYGILSVPAIFVCDWSFCLDKSCSYQQSHPVIGN